MQATIYKHRAKVASDEAAQKRLVGGTDEANVVHLHQRSRYTHLRRALPLARGVGLVGCR